MPTAAQRVFALPELVEQVLLAHASASKTPEHASIITDIFAFRRISRIFEGTVHNSQRLRWRIGLRGPLRNVRRTNRVKEVAPSWLLNDNLDIPPFKFFGIAVSQVPGAYKETKFLELNFKVSANYFASEYQGSQGFRAGIAGRSGKIHSNKDQSWRLVKLTTRPVPVEVTVEIVSMHTREEIQAGHPLMSSYTEDVRFGPGQGTMGDLADFFEEIGRRSIRKHERKRVKHEGMFWSDVRRERTISRTSEVVFGFLSVCFCIGMIFSAAKGIHNWLSTHPREVSMICWTIVGTGLIVVILMVVGAVRVSWAIAEEEARHHRNSSRLGVFN